jgi:hypothetical protein
MGQQVLDRYGRIVGGRMPKRNPWQVLGDRVVEPDLALLAELHDGGRREELAVGRHAEPSVELHGTARLDVRVPEPLRPDQVLIGDDAHDYPRELADRDLAVEPGREEADLRLHIGIVRRG